MRDATADQRCPLELLDHPKLVTQICSLERRTARSGKDSIDALGHEDIANAVSGAVTGLILQDWSGSRAMLEIARQETAAMKANGTWPFPPDNDKPMPIEREWARGSVEWQLQQEGKLGPPEQKQIPAHHIGRTGSFDDEMNEKFRPMGMIG